MTYDLTGDINKEDVLDDSIEKETLSIIERLIGKKLDLEIKDQGQLLDFLNNPDKFLEDKDTAREVEDLREVILGMSDVYNA